MEKILYLEPIRYEDLPLIMAWRNNPIVYKYFKLQDKPLTWEEHLNFWTNIKDRIDAMIIYEGRKVGVVSCSNMKDEYWTIGIYIGEVTLHGSGIGSTAVKKLMDELGYPRYEAYVDPENEASQKLFEKCGYLRADEMKNGSLVYFYG